MMYQNDVAARGNVIRELNIAEIEEIAGGPIPVALWVAGMALVGVLGTAGASVYESTSTDDCTTTTTTTTNGNTTTTVESTVCT